MAALGALCAVLAFAAFTYLVITEWRRFVATQQALTDAINGLSPKLAALSVSIDALIASQGTVPDALVQSVNDVSSGIDTIAAKVAAANPPA